MLRFILGALIGGAIGAALGYFGQCATGTCPLTANWKRGALFGVVLGLVFTANMGGTVSRAVSESTANVKRISEADFEAEVLKASSPVVVDFFANWCGPCRRLSPLLDKVAGEFAGQVKVVKVNVDEAPALARQFRIQGIPAIKFFRGGQEVGGTVGLISEAELVSHFTRLAGQTASAAK